MQRVLVIGIPGAGKSTFARGLVQRTGLPLIHLDQVFWNPGWVMTPYPRFRERVAALVEGEHWIIEGNYDRSLDLRLPRADTVFWFDFDRVRALLRVVRRVARSYGTVRPDMAPGCPERIDWEFMRYVWEFNKHSRPRIEPVLAAHGSHAVVHIIRNDREAGRALEAAAMGRGN